MLNVPLGNFLDQMPKLAKWGKKISKQGQYHTKEFYTDDGYISLQELPSGCVHTKSDTAMKCRVSPFLFQTDTQPPSGPPTLPYQCLCCGISRRFDTKHSDEQDSASHSGSCNVNYVRFLWGRSCRTTLPPLNAAPDLARMRS